MSELIDRLLLIDKLDQWQKKALDAKDLTSFYALVYFKAILQEAPTIDAEPVKHGRWVAIPSAHDTRIAKCSMCGFWQKSNGNDKTGNFLIHNAVYKYCSGCGAKMDGGADNG